MLKLLQISLIGEATLMDNSVKEVSVLLSKGLTVDSNHELEETFDSLIRMPLKEAVQGHHHVGEGVFQVPVAHLELLEEGLRDF